MVKIEEIRAMEILDSRAKPTVECEVVLSDGSRGCAQVPSGASRGSAEACELRDGDVKRYHGQGVLSAIESVRGKIREALVGKDAYDSDGADRIMIALDGTQNKSNLGANAILSVSIAQRRAAAASLGIPLYRYLGGSELYEMPVPMLNVLNGGAHAANNLDVQEFMLLPLGADSFSDAMRIAVEVYHTLGTILRSRSLSVGVGDEGGFAPDLRSDEEAIELLVKAIRESGYEAGRDVAIGLDVAASEWWSGKSYRLPKRGINMTSDELCGYLTSLVEKYPIISIEDGMGETDGYGWSRLGETLSRRGILLVGDDLFVTDAKRVEEGARAGLANALLVKPNQIGTVSEAMRAVRTAERNGYKTVASHRSGECEDSSIADLAVGMRTQLVKMGAPARGERTAKYNRLMKIEQELKQTEYMGRILLGKSRFSS